MVLCLLGLTGFESQDEVNRKHVEHGLLARKYQHTLLNGEYNYAMAA